MRGQTYTPETESLLSEVKAKGLNVWGMLGLFKKRSKLRHPIPDEVIQSVCLEYLERHDEINQSFPYFLVVLERKSKEYFGRQSEVEGQRYKKEPLGIKNIMQELSRQ